VEGKDVNDLVKLCITWVVEGIRQRRSRSPKKTWWDCVKNDVESLDLCAVQEKVEKEN